MLSSSECEAQGGKWSKCPFLAHAKMPSDHTNTAFVTSGPESCHNALGMGLPLATAQKRQLIQNTVVHMLRGAGRLEQCRSYIGSL